MVTHVRTILAGRPRPVSLWSWLPALVVLYLSGCTSGPMRVDETYYLGASNGADRVYYRVNVQGRTYLGDSEFRQGWFPAYAVDALFGDVSDEGSAEALTTREELRRQIDQKLIETRKKYLARAVDPEATPDELRKLLAAVIRVRMAARESTGDLGNQAVVMEYKPQADLITAHAGQKLVLFLSSDPDAIISKLGDLAEDTRTEQLFNTFSSVVKARTMQEQDRARAEQRENLDQADQLTVQLSHLLSTLEDGGNPVMNREKLLGAIDALISILEIDE